MFSCCWFVPLCFVFRSRKIVIACNNGLFSVKHKVMSKCAACTPFRIATPTKFVHLYVRSFLLIRSFIFLIALLGLVRFVHVVTVVVVALFSARSFLLLLMFFRYFRSNPSSFVYDHCCCSSIENCMEYKYRVCAARHPNAPMLNAALVAVVILSLRCASTENIRIAFLFRYSTSTFISEE